MKKKSISLFFLQRNNSRYLLQYFIKRNYLEYINNKKNNISPFLLLPPPPLIIEVFVYFFVNKQLLRKKNHFFKELLTNVDQRVKINVLLLALDLFWKRNLKNYNYYCNNMFLKKSKLMKMEKKIWRRYELLTKKKQKFQKLI